MLVWKESIYIIKLLATGYCTEQNKLNNFSVHTYSRVVVFVLLQMFNFLLQPFDLVFHLLVFS